MNQHRTKDPAERAASIADNEAEKIWQQTGDYYKWYEKWMIVYENALFEFAYQG